MLKFECMGEPGQGAAGQCPSAPFESAASDLLEQPHAGLGLGMLPEAA
ncbi:hypothetical protein B2K_40205 [Paenibacillus mucilaginosus K02]|uniref:Uncharacterized protein n=1 Tax=Paenibacillus mucilaginosus K02 TaxID=997761 RepID=R9UPN4_9BACL|nr:hypothetical protein B2K_40205 [Paenibacillus mucilaginosus K02]